LQTCRKSCSLLAGILEEFTSPDNYTLDGEPLAVTIILLKGCGWETEVVKMNVYYYYNQLMPLIPML
jgi:hypothetical protein